MKTALTELIEELELMAQNDSVNAIIHKAYIDLAKKYLEKEEEQLEKAREKGIRSGVENACKTMENLKQFIFKHENISNPFTIIG